MLESWVHIARMLAHRLFTHWMVTMSSSHASRKLFFVIGTWQWLAFLLIFKRKKCLLDWKIFVACGPRGCAPNETHNNCALERIFEGFWFSQSQRLPLTMQFFFFLLVRPLTRVFLELWGGVEVVIVVLNDFFHTNEVVAVHY